jgi:flagellin
MSLRINYNDSFNAHRQLSASSDKLGKSMEKLSSGFRINRAADDAPGLGISERMRGQIRGYAQAQRNALDGISMANTADGALNEITSMLQRVRELAVQYQSGSNDVTARTAIATEAQGLGTEINTIIANTQFNGINLLNNTTATDLQIGPNAGNTLSVTGVDAAATMTTLAINTLFPLAGTAGTATITNVDTAINAISAFRGAFGAVTNRLDYTISNLGVAQENLMASESRIRDVDMAQEMATLSRLQILQESGMSMLSQARQNKQSVLQLLR